MPDASYVPQSWLNPLADCRPARTDGFGIHALEPIPAGTTVAAFGGQVVDRVTLHSLDDESRTHAIQIDEDLFLASSPPFDAADYVNHSCEPNCGLIGAILGHSSVITTRGYQHVTTELSRRALERLAAQLGLPGGEATA